MKRLRTDTKPNAHLLKDETNKSLSQNEVTKRLKEKMKSKCIQEKWKNIVNRCLEAAVNVLGRKIEPKRLQMKKS